MYSLNKVHLIGNAGQPAKLEYSANGTAYCRFTLATYEKYNDVEKTSWHTIVAFGKTAELLGQYLHKGDKVYIEGKLDYNTYEHEGVKKTSTNIIVRDFLLLSKKKGAEQSPPADENVSQAPPDEDDVLPF